MGMLFEGKWIDEDRIIEGGAFKRPESGLDRSESKANMSFLAAQGIPPGRFHLVSSMSCPWSQRVNLLRYQKELADVIPIQIAGGARVEGYPVNDGKLWQVPGSDRKIRHLHQLYSLSHSDFTGRVTVPLLWDSVDQRIISNESGDIMRFFNALDPRSGANARDFFPAALASDIDDLDRWLYDNLSNAAYRAGLAQSQAAYDTAAGSVFAAMDHLERRLAGHRYLLGAMLTAADWLLFPVLVRFDIAYHSLFRCSRRRLVDYSNLWAYARDLYQRPMVAETVDFPLIQRGYWQNDGDTNPHGILPMMPDMNWEMAHDRDRFGSETISFHPGDADAGVG